MAEKAQGALDLERKHYKKEDILSAGDVGNVLEVYRRASGERKGYERLSDFQTAVADRLHQLGDEEKAYEFTLLAGQTENMERMAAITGGLEGVQQEFKKTTGRLEEASERIRGSGAVVGDAAEKILSTGNIFSRAADRVETASRTIETASYRMNH